LKLELLQHASSFKPRGAFMNLLTRDVPPAGVVAASGGNHGAAVAYAAMRLGIPAKIFVPTVSPQAKVQRIKDYGAEVVIAGDRYADALAASEDWIAASGALSVHAYDQVETLLGQGTTALEFENQVSGLDTVLVAVGGGGFIGGIAAWFGGRVKVVGVEPRTSCALHSALAAGGPVDAGAPLSPGRAMMVVSPSPFEATTRVAFTMVQAGPAVVSVHDAAGRRVAVLADSERAEGRHSILWSGRDGSGRPVPAGVYFFRLQTNGLAQTCKVVRLR